MTKIWQRYFYKQIVSTTLLFLLLFFGLYVLIDYASHLSSVHYYHSKLHIGEFFIHYLAEFSLRAEILLPFALLIGSIHTLTKLNSQRELLALLAGGISLRKLMIPFLTVGLIATALLYLNNEFFVPKAYTHLFDLGDKYAMQKSKGSQELRAHHLNLEDGSLLIYKEFDPIAKIFYEAYWVKSFQEVYRIEILEPFASPPKGSFVDLFKGEGQAFRYQDSYPNYLFNEMKLNKKKLSDTLRSQGELPLSLLLKEAPSESAALENEKAARALTALFQKLTFPWLALLAVIAPAPFCLRFSRQLPIFLIFAGGIFSLVAIYLAMDAAIVLSERQVISPLVAIFCPMALFLALGIVRFIRIRT